MPSTLDGYPLGINPNRKADIHFAVVFSLTKKVTECGSRSNLHTFDSESVSIVNIVTVVTM